MKLTQKNTIVLGIFFVLFTFFTINLYLPISNINSISREDNLQNSGISAVLMNGNSDWIDFKNMGYCTGNGTYSDPYILKNSIINGGAGPNCVHIENTDVYFIIENCTLYHSQVFGTGIYLVNVSNSQILNNNCTWKYPNDNSYFGIDLDHCTNNTVAGNVANDGWVGIRLYYSDNNTISGNTANNNKNSHTYPELGRGILLYMSNNNKIFENIANNNAIGTDLVSSDYNLIANNTLLENDNCIQISSDSEGNTLENNNCGQEEGTIPGYNLIPLLCLLIIGIIFKTKKMKHSQNQ